MPSKRVVAIIQARMTSSRLPGKVLLDLCGEPVLGWVVERARRAHSLDEVMVATTTDAADEVLVDFCRARGYAVFQGNVFDVLDRYYRAAQQARADVIVRLTADCPLIDPAEIDHVVAEFFEQKVDFAANRLPPPWKRTYPIGLDIEVCSFQALERAWREAGQKYEREHVLPYLYDQAGRFKTYLVNASSDYGQLRWTLDTPADLEFLRSVCRYFAFEDPIHWKDVLAVLEEHPDLAAINANVQHKSVTDVDKRF
jgi:spore coat polysaccharide biosynthesis protein SpsF